MFGLGALGKLLVLLGVFIILGLRGSEWVKLYLLEHAS